MTDTPEWLVLERRAHAEEHARAEMPIGYCLDGCGYECQRCWELDDAAPIREASKA